MCMNSFKNMRKYVVILPKWLVFLPKTDVFLHRISAVKKTAGESGYLSPASAPDKPVDMAWKHFSR